MTKEEFHKYTDKQIAQHKKAKAFIDSYYEGSHKTRAYKVCGPLTKANAEFYKRSELIFIGKAQDVHKDGIIFKVVAQNIPLVYPGKRYPIGAREDTIHKVYFKDFLELGSETTVEDIALEELPVYMGYEYVNGKLLKELMQR